MNERLITRRDALTTLGGGFSSLILADLFRGGASRYSASSSFQSTFSREWDQVSVTTTPWGLAWEVGARRGSARAMRHEDGKGKATADQGRRSPAE